MERQNRSLINIYYRKCRDIFKELPIYLKLRQNMKYLQRGLIQFLLWDFDVCGKQFNSNKINFQCNKEIKNKNTEICVILLMQGLFQARNKIKTSYKNVG